MDRGREWRQPRKSWAEDFGIRKKKNSELWFEARGRKLIFGARRGQTSSLRRGGIRWKSQHRKKLCLTLLMSKNLKLEKVIKSFVPEPKKKKRVVKCFECFTDSYAYEHYEHFMQVNILFVFLDVDMLHDVTVQYVIHNTKMTPFLRDCLKYILKVLFTNPSARAGYDTRSIFKRSLTGFEFRVFLLLD